VSDETGDALARAKAGLAAEQTTTEQCERELLDRIAVGLPGAIDGIARRAAESQPAVTRQLGSSGITVLRAELAAKADQLATEIRAAQINWPREQPVRYGEVPTRHLDAALFSYLHGRRMDVLVEVLHRHGFAIRGDGEHGAQDLVNPHDLYREEWISPLAEARTSLASAESRVRAAQQSDAEAAVRLIWDGSED
jgi:hypothetical protein